MKSFHQICLIYKAKLQGSNWLARCPAHDDEEPSLAIEEGAGGRTLFKCHAGCRTEDVLSAKGLDWGDVLPDESVSYWNPVGGASERVWVIRDLGGAEVARHIRRGKKGGGKVFSWERNGSPGLKGLAGKDLPLYGCEKVRGYSAAKSIFVVEGEKACDACWELGLQAVGTVTGAAGTPSSVTLAVLKGFKVILWPDFDAVGVAHMERIAAKLEGRASSVRWVAFRDSKGCDAADYRGDQEGLKRLIQSKAPVVEKAEVLEFPAGERPEMSFEKIAFDEFRLTAGETVFELRNVKRERGELIGDLVARSSLPGQVLANVPLLDGKMNLSSIQARKAIANHISERFVLSDSTSGYRDKAYWMDFLEKLCHEVRKDSQSPAEISLISDLPEISDEWNVGTQTSVVPVFTENVNILFGPPGALKTYLMLAMAGDLVKAGHKILFVDYENDAATYKGRWAEIWGPTDLDAWRTQPTQPFPAEASTLRRWVREKGITFVMVDSVSAACAPIEESETAQNYLAAARSLGVGSLHLAHVTKSSKMQGRKMPFGSMMWEAQARSLWHVETVERGDHSQVIELTHTKVSRGAMLANRCFKAIWKPGEFWLEPQECKERKASDDTSEIVGSAMKIHKILAQLGEMTVETLSKKSGLSKSLIYNITNKNKDHFSRDKGIVSVKLDIDERNEDE